MKPNEVYKFFNGTKINSGLKALESIPSELAVLDAQKPLVITSKSSTGNGLAGTLVNALKESEIVIGALYDDIPDTATIRLIYELNVLFMDRGCDSIIALGSGAVTDAAKGLAVLLSEESQDLLQYAGIDRVSPRTKPLLVIPTADLAGTEVTTTATIDRQIIISDYLFPDIVIIDPRMIRPAAPVSILNTAMTSLTQSVEAFIHPAYNPMADAFASGAIQFVYENILTAIRKPGDSSESLAIVNAACMAGIAFSNTKEGIVYTLGKALSDVTGYSAPLCMGIILPHYLEYILNNKVKVNDKLLLAIAGIDLYCETPAEDRLKKAAGLLHGLNKRLFPLLPGSLKEAKIPGYKIEEAARRTAVSSNNQYSIKESMSILDLAWGVTYSKTHGDPAKRS